VSVNCQWDWHKEFRPVPRGCSEDWKVEINGAIG